MGTIYRTNCGCISSEPEPSIGDARYADPELDFDAEHARWWERWMAECNEHAEATGHQA